ncbi:MAG: hypothetical protein NC078_10300 [Ruminococcus sp.]|nr:hypothetical protein [Ruminococcus sp.]
MSRVRSELSEKNVYYLEKHRYLELKHFCLQYESWRRHYSEFDGVSTPMYEQPEKIRNFKSSPTEKCAVARAFYSQRMEMLERVAEYTDEVLGKYILKAVTKGVSYDILKASDNIPCCRGTYYELYRRFFKLLDKERG